jgi:hypothetical protein
MTTAMTTTMTMETTMTNELAPQRMACAVGRVVERDLAREGAPPRMTMLPASLLRAASATSHDAPILGETDLDSEPATERLRRVAHEAVAALRGRPTT